MSEMTAEMTANSALAQSVAASLATRNNDGAFLVHTLVSRVIRFHDGKPARRQDLRTAALGTLNAEMPAVADIRAHARLADFLPHDVPTP